MVRLSVNELTTYRWSFEEDVARYCEAGLRGIGVWRQKLSDYGEDKGIELLCESGLQVSNLLWAGGFTGSDGRTYRDSVQDAAEAIRLAGALHCPCLVVYSGGRGGHTQRHARRLLSSALRKLAPIAEEESVHLALEPMRPACAADWTILTSLGDAMDVISEIDHPHVQLAFDTYHLAEGEDILPRIEQLVDLTAIVHLGDAKCVARDEQNRCPLGEGHVPLQEIITRFSQCGYAGYYDIELIGEDVEAIDYHDLIEHSIEVCEQLLAAPI